MILVGDVAVAHGHGFQMIGFPAATDVVPWVVNLEGALATTSSVTPRWGTYNSEAWPILFGTRRLGPVFLGNNHIHDLPGGPETTVSWLRGMGLLHFGFRNNEVLPAVLCGDYCLIGFGWSVIGCRTGDNVFAVNPLSGGAVREQVKRALQQHPRKRLVVVMHWNYEFERYPQPGHRLLAHQLIELGAYVVVGHHPHVVGPVEVYRGRTIAYSLGNWAFSQGHFFGGRLSFPSASYPQLALELGAACDLLHHAKFIPPGTISYLASERVSDSMSLRAPFQGLGHEAYIRWFREHRVKRSLLPVYTHPDDTVVNRANDRFVALRQSLVDGAAKVGIKRLRRSS